MLANQEPIDVDVQMTAEEAGDVVGMLAEAAELMRLLQERITSAQSPTGVSIKLTERTDWEILMASIKLVSGRMLRLSAGRQDEVGRLYLKMAQDGFALAQRLEKIAPGPTLP